MTRNIYGLLCTAIILFISMCSCALNKEVQYMQDIQPGTLENSNTSLGLLIEPDDLLSIIVTTKDPELGTLFNLQPGTINADIHSSNGSIAWTLLAISYFLFWERFMWQASPALNLKP